MKPTWMPQITGRLDHMIEVQIPRDPQVTAYRFLAYRTLDGCRLTPVELFQISAGDHFVSPSLVQYRGSRWADRNTVGYTVARWDPDDFYDPTNVAKLGLPNDAETCYLVVDEWDVAAATWVNRSPILIVQDPTLFALQSPWLTAYGTAPNVGAVTVGAPPPSTFLHFHVPQAARGLMLINNSNDTLYAALSPAQPVFPIPSGSSIETTLGMTDQWLLGAVANNVSFTALFNIINVSTP